MNAPKDFDDRKEPSADAVLLTDFTAIYQTYGYESPQATAFMEAHANNQSFTELARLSAVLRDALIIRDIIGDEGDMMDDESSTDFEE